MSVKKKAATKSWPKTSWENVIDRAERIVFRLIAGDSAGTCFAVSIGTSPKSRSIHYMFATAWHVVKDIAGSDKPIYMVAADGKTVCEATAGCYAIFPLGSEAFDTALIMVRSSEKIVSQSDLMPIFGTESQMPRGTEIGIVGFPGIVEGEFCFFRGVISGYLNHPPTYLVDAVGINGISGGPAFDDHAQIIGLVSSYIPNKVNEYTMLPGLLALIPIGLIRYWMESKMKARVL
jgi:hypothetical protein